MDQIVMVQEEPRGPSQLVEVPVLTNGQTRVPFPDIQQLRSQQGQVIIIKAIRLVTSDILTNGVINPQANAPLAELQKISLVIYCEGWEKAQFTPILELNDVALPGGTFPHRYRQTNYDNWRNVDWSKTYLQYANTTVSANAPYVVLLNVLYIKLDAQGRPITGPS